MRGEIDFAESLRERVATLEGLSKSAVETCAKKITVTNGVPTLVRAVHERGGVIAVVSGGFTDVLDPLAAELGLDEWRANRLEWADDRLTGRVHPPVIDGAAKREALIEWRAKYRVPKESVIAVGDGANDLAMMAEAALGVAFDAKPIVRSKANISLSTRDLGMLVPLLP